MNEKTRILPIFISFQGCPFKCLYCNQEKITGTEDMTPQKAKKEIEEGLKKGGPLELAFYGGTLTSLDPNLQEAYMELARPYLGKEILSVRCSTRPDALDLDWLNHLKGLGLKRIELGCQSLDDSVLKGLGRGHGRKEIEEGVRIVRKAGLSLGIQQMLGLPGEDLDSFKRSLQGIINLKPDFVRLYPCLVLKGTGLETLYKRGLYTPLNLDEAILWASYALKAYTQDKIPMIRLGLQATDEISWGKDLLAGPFHPSFGQMVKTHYLVNLVKDKVEGDKILEILGPGRAISNLVGQKKWGRRHLEEGQGPISFKSSSKGDLQIKCKQKEYLIGEDLVCI